MFGFHRHTTSDASDISNWSCDDTFLLQSILLNGSKAKCPTVKFSKVLIVNDSTTAFITKKVSTPGSTKSVIDRYYSN